MEQLSPQANVYSSNAYKNYWREQERPFLTAEPDEEKTKNLNEGITTIHQNYHAGYGSPSYAKISVQQDGQTVYQYTNICPHYHFEKVLRHTNGHLYYIFRLDAQGYSVLNLDTLVVHHYVPQNMLNNPNDESLFLFELQYNIENQMLIATCCYWGPVDRPLLFDVSQPEVLPYPCCDIPATDDWFKAKEVTCAKWQNEDILYSYNEVDEYGKEIILCWTQEDYLKALCGK